MGSSNKKDKSRRAFFQDVTTGAAGVAVASALVQLGAPNLVAAPQSWTKVFVLQRSLVLERLALALCNLSPQSKDLAFS